MHITADLNVVVSAEPDDVALPWDLLWDLLWETSAELLTNKTGHSCCGDFCDTACYVNKHPCIVPGERWVLFDMHVAH